MKTYWQRRKHGTNYWWVEANNNSNNNNKLIQNGMHRFIERIAQNGLWQCMRWNGGMYECVWFHRRSICETRSRGAGIIQYD